MLGMRSACSAELDDLVVGYKELSYLLSPGDAFLVQKSSSVTHFAIRLCVYSSVSFAFLGAIPHFIVRNSWGPKWGNDGYLKIRIGENVCGE